jgi:hypothetical protein
MNILHYVFLYIHVLLAFVFCIAVCDVLCVGCCITLSNAESAASSLYHCCVYCEEHFTIRNGLFFVLYFSRILKFYKCGPDPKMCIYADSSPFTQFVWDKI